MPITAKIDEFGKPAWIALIILGFMAWWPLGLAALAFAIGSGRMGCGLSRHEPLAAQDGSHAAQDGPLRDRMAAAASRLRAVERQPRLRRIPERDLRRLEDEQKEFHDFLDRLRMAKDKSEFDQFMADGATLKAGRPSPELIAAFECRSERRLAANTAADGCRLHNTTV